MAMPGASQTVLSWLLAFLFQGQTIPLTSTTLYLSAHTGDPGGTGANEVTAAGYQRVAISRQVQDWNGPTSLTPRGMQVQNAALIQFPAPTADWGTVTHLGLWDAPTGGTFLWQFALTAPVTVVAGGSALALLTNTLTAQAL